MLSGEQRIEDPVEAGSHDDACGGRRWKEMPRFGTSLLEFPLEIHQGHLDVAHGHLRRSVAE